MANFLTTKLSYKLSHMHTIINGDGSAGSIFDISKYRDTCEKFDTDTSWYRDTSIFLVLNAHCSIPTIFLIPSILSPFVEAEAQLPYFPYGYAYKKHTPIVFL